MLESREKKMPRSNYYCTRQQRRLLCLKKQLNPSLVSSNIHYYPTVRSVEGGMLIVEYHGGHYSSLAAYYGYTADRDQILRDRNLLFRGFTDGGG